MVSETSESASCAAKLSALADPTRLAVLRVLLQGPRHVNEINEHLSVAPNLLSHHLRILRAAGLVKSTRDGKAVTYAVAQGVGAGAERDGIYLGCCSLTFHPRSGRRKG